MKKTLISAATFLILNFLALYIGSVFTEPGVQSEWYQLADKAPWTPAGWVFGAAWTVIMILYAFYMSELWRITADKRTLTFVYSIQWILNVSWNYMFFFLQSPLIAEMILFSLTVLLIYQYIRYGKKGRKWNSLLLLPYIIWLCLANSLNIYFVMNN